MMDDPRALAARLIAASPLAMSLEDALKQKRERREQLLAVPPLSEPDFSPEPFPFLDSPQDFARDFIAKKRSDRGSKPVARSKTNKAPPKKSGPFTVITGGLDGDNDRDG